MEIYLGKKKFKEHSFKDWNGKERPKSIYVSTVQKTFAIKKAINYRG